MRHVAAIVVLTLLAVGCEKKPEGPQASQVPSPPRPAEDVRPMDEPVRLTDIAPPDRPATPAATGASELAAAPTTVKPAGSAPPPPAPASARSALRTHTVSKGETLWSIARAQLGDGKRWRDIVQLNPGLDPAKLRVGQVVNLPAR